jgi:hypothetical protein
LQALQLENIMQAKTGSGRWNTDGARLRGRRASLPVIGDVWAQ